MRTEFDYWERVTDVPYNIPTDMARKTINFTSIETKVFQYRDSIDKYKNTLIQRYGIPSDFYEAKENAESEEQYKLICVIEQLDCAVAAMEEIIETHLPQ